MTGLGVAVGDAAYASTGLLGVEMLVARAGSVLIVLRVIGGLYLIWLGLGMITRSERLVPSGRIEQAAGELKRCFTRGLLTDLSNPNTVIFFASIFAVAYVPGGPAWVPAATLGAIVSFSVLWRTALSFCFSRQVIRDVYERFNTLINRLCGAVLSAIGLRFVFSE